MKKRIARKIWSFSENNKIPLGRYAHIVFGYMIGKPYRKVLTKKDIVR